MVKNKIEEYVSDVLVIEEEINSDNRISTSDEVGASSSIINNEYDIVYYLNTSYPLDVALSRGYAALKNKGKFIINNPAITQWDVYSEYAKSLFCIEKETQKEIILAKELR